jgi:hypothetical protein
MNPPRPDFLRIADLLDGLLSPAEEAELRRALEADPELKRRYREMAAAHSLLATPLDVSPPADLLGAVLAAVREERARARAAALVLPRWLENALVVSCAVGLAALVASLRVAGPVAAEWIGRLAVEGTRVFGLGTRALVDLAQWDWIVRLLGTLGRASGTVLGSSAEPLLGLSLVPLALTAALAAVLLRSRLLRPGGLGNAHVLA